MVVSVIHLTIHFCSLCITSKTECFNFSSGGGKVFKGRLAYSVTVIMLAIKNSKFNR